MAGVDVGLCRVTRDSVGQRLRDHPKRLGKAGAGIGTIAGGMLAILTAAIAVRNMSFMALPLFPESARRRANRVARRWCSSSSAII